MIWNTWDVVIYVGLNLLETRLDDDGAFYPEISLYCTIRKIPLSASGNI